MQRWTATEYVDAYQHYQPVPGTVVSLEDYERALAEKDREIEARDRELGKLDAELIVHNAASQQLIAQAARFAKQCVTPIRGKTAIQIAVEAQAFLKEHKL